MLKNYSVFFIMVFCIFLASCEKAVDFSGFSSGYDKAIEKTANKNLLINILRSAYQQPTHFTSVSGVSGTSSLSAPTANLTLPFDQIFSLSRNGSSAFINTPFFSQSSSVTVSPLTTSEFLSGMLTQASPETFHFYISQGVPRELIFSLLVESIEYEYKGTRDKVRNDPTDERYEEFKSVLATVIKMGLTAEYVTGFAPVGPVLTEDQAKDPDRISTAIDAGMTLEAVKLPVSPASRSPSNHYQMFAPFSYSRFCFSKLGEGSEDLPRSMLCNSKEAPVDKGLLTIGKGSKTLKNASLRIIPRSTRGIFEYLGKVVYQQVERKAATPVILTSEEAKKYNYQQTGDRLLVIEKNNRKSDDIVSVKLDGNTFSIPARKNGFSNHVLALVSEILNLSKTVNSLAPANTIITK